MIQGGNRYSTVRNGFASLLSLILLLVSCTSAEQTADPSSITSTPPQPTSTPNPDPMATAWDDRSIFKNGLVQSQQPVLDRLNGASVYHLEFKIADDLLHVTGHEEVQYTNTETVALAEIQLRLFPN